MALPSDASLALPRLKLPKAALTPPCHLASIPRRGQIGPGTDRTTWAQPQPAELIRPFRVAEVAQ